MTQRKMAIEDAVRWAYREELPKAARAQPLLALGPAGASSPGATVDWVADTWCLPDNAFGVVLDPTATEEPHPDALKIHEAVLALDHVAAEIPDDWSGLDGVELFGQDASVMGRVLESLTRFDENGERVLRIRVSQIVRTAAIIGLPDMIVDAPALKVEVGANGKPRWWRMVPGTDIFGHPYQVEMDGFDAKRRRPYPDAYQRRYLDPDPAPSLANRARAELWRAALDVLLEELDGRLEAIHLLPSPVPLQPWHAGGRCTWPDLSVPRWKLQRHVSNHPIAGRRWKGRVRKPQDA